jgi:phospholipase C
MDRELLNAAGARNWPRPVGKERWLMPDRPHALDHIVVILFENRSLDNVLGHLYGPGMARTSMGSSARI